MELHRNYNVGVNKNFCENILINLNKIIQNKSENLI